MHWYMVEVMSWQNILDKGVGVGNGGLAVIENERSLSKLSAPWINTLHVRFPIMGQVGLGLTR